MNEIDEIPPGHESASDFHRFAARASEYIFAPSLRDVVIEQEINEGRKRVDILLTNGAESGFFEALIKIFRIRCPYVFAECKNYAADPGNPELDQLIGRFSDKGGEVGILMCRHVKNREAMLRRCQDIVNAGQGYVFVLDDKDLKEMISFCCEGNSEAVDRFLERRLRHLILRTNVVG